MDAIKTWLSGKKTYIVTVAGLLTSAVAWATGTIDTKTMVEAIFAAVLVFTGRAAIAKVEEKVS
jgi:hypothetical protein